MHLALPRIVNRVSLKWNAESKMRNKKVRNAGSECGKLVIKAFYVNIRDNLPDEASPWGETGSASGVK